MRNILTAARVMEKLARKMRIAPVCVSNLAIMIKIKSVRRIRSVARAVNASAFA